MSSSGQLWIVTRKHPPAVGGMEELSYQTARQLARVRTIRLLSWGHSQIWLPLFAIYAGLRLMAGLLGRRVEVLLLGDPVLAVLGWLAARFGVPVVCVVHGLDLTWRSALYQAYLRRFFWGRMDGFICISRYTADLVRAGGAPTQRVFVVPVGVTVPRQMRPAALDGDPVLLFIGRLVARKGAAWFVSEVLPGLARTFPGARLCIVGEGPERRRIDAAAKQQGVTKHVVLAGAVDEDTKWSLLARCDAAVVPNVPVDGDVEGFGIVALEAAAAGKPVFVADLEGLRDAVTDGVNGWRLPPGNAAAWLDGLTSRLRDRELLRRQGEKARLHVTRNFDWESIGERYAAIIDGISPRR
jgi:phosphatidylinositol alpha-1,6-mannosyltransferase